MSEALPCPECGAGLLVDTIEDCRLQDGLCVRRLRHFRCRACGSRFFDDEAMQRIQSMRAAARKHAA
ncbi:MAG: hypothetical protein AB1714_12640 [Acidobacteriota bacterium]